MSERDAGVIMILLSIIGLLLWSIESQLKKCAYFLKSCADNLASIDANTDTEVSDD